VVSPTRAANRLAIRRRHEQGRLASRRERRLAISFLLPAIVLVTVLVYVPLGRAVYDSLFTTAFFSVRPRFVGVEQYTDILSDATFWTVVKNSLVWTGTVVLLQNAVGLATAILLNQKLPLRRLTRTFVLIPWVLPGIVAALLWKFMYDPQLGLVNALLVSAGAISDEVPWLADSTTAMAAVVLAAVWKGFPFSTVVYLAALQGVDQDLTDAAMVDGAGPWQRFRYVVVPSISGVIRLNVLLTTLFTFNYFDMIWVATRGGPRNATHIFPTYIFEVFRQFEYGTAAAYGLIAAIMLALVALLYIRELRPGQSL
jgi:multiple sugar transport system permease protein